VASFSERNGYKPVRTLVQRDDLDAETRMALWNVVGALPGIFLDRGEQGVQRQVLESLWIHHFHYARDEYSTDAIVWKLIKKSILSADFHEAFDLVEALIKYLRMNSAHRMPQLSPTIEGVINDRFESNLVGFRLIGAEIVPVDTATEATAISDAVAATDTIEGARHHLHRAIELLADRQSPDYPNSIKESISAVESVCRAVTGEQTLGAAVRKLGNAGVVIHPALASAWGKMYGWTSDADGIRHGGIDAARADQSLAKYMLVTCSAFVSHVIETGRKAGLI
jgi:hypothetical protein